MHWELSEKYFANHPSNPLDPLEGQLVLPNRALSLHSQITDNLLTISLKLELLSVARLRIDLHV